MFSLLLDLNQLANLNFDISLESLDLTGGADHANFQKLLWEILKYSLYLTANERRNFPELTRLSWN